MFSFFFSFAVCSYFPPDHYFQRYDRIVSERSRGGMRSVLPAPRLLCRLPLDRKLLSFGGGGVIQVIHSIVANPTDACGFV